MILQKCFCYFVLKILNKLEVGELFLELPNGKSYKFGRSQSTESIKADIRVNEWDVFFNLIRKGDIGFGEDYMQGKWETSDLYSLLLLALKNQTILSSLINGNRLSLLKKITEHRKNENTLNKSRDNIKYHYDLGNDFYSLWLDESLTYSSAVFNNHPQGKQVSLFEAQKFKLDRALDFLGPIREDASVCEIGFGWGSLAQRIYSETQYKYHGITLSAKQLEYVKEKFLYSNNSNRLKFELKDYRLLNNKYDGIVSIEMFEAVGEKYWDEYFSMIARCLNKTSKAVIQTILIKDDKFEKYRKGVDFIQMYIFPGGMLPTKNILKGLADRNYLKIHDEFYFSKDYAETLKRWAANFEECNHKFNALGLNEEFKRMWKFYLNYCRSGFEVGDINVGQFVLAKR